MTAPPIDAARAEAGAALRAELGRVRGQLAAGLEAAPAGAVAAAALADVYDRAIVARWRAALVGETAPLALVATGGWARRELAPYSDIDFIVVHAGAEAAARRVADRLLYPLWDARVAVGHAVREPRECAKLAKDDLATATALCDLRPIVGDLGLTETLLAAARAAIAPAGDADRLIAALADDQARRHARFGDSLYRLEPNLKQGIGGLRDLAIAVWAARARWLLAESPWPSPAESIERLAALGHVRPREAAALLAARDFLLALRARVQLRIGRANDHLTFELQEAIAPAWYPALAPAAESRAAVAPAVEALMRDFYLHARAIGDLAERLLARARLPRRRAPRVRTLDGVVAVIDGELAVTAPARLVEAPAEQVRVFRVAVEHGLAVAAATKDAIADAAITAGAALFGDRAAGWQFLDALCDPRDRAQPSALEWLHRLGVVDAIVPEWAPCTGRVQHDLYHVYTVDQHQLYAVAMLKQLARGELADVHPIATAAYAQVARVAPLYLATLLHDVGKPHGKGHAEKGAVIGGVVARRLGLDERDAATVEFLIRQHLTMAHVSQRRDLSDPDVVARFVERVGDAQRLAALYVLTLCDTAMTAPDSLTAWKAELLRELYVRASERLAQDGLAPAAPPVGTDAAAPPRATGEMDPGIAGSIAAGLDPRFAAQLTAEQAARHVRLAAHVQGHGAAVGLAVTALPTPGVGEIAVVAPDVHGVLAAITGVLAAHRVDVLGAVVGRAVTPDGALALDLFVVRGPAGAAITAGDPRWKRIEDDLAELCASGPPTAAAVAALVARRRPRSGLPPRVTPAVPTEVRFDLDESSDATIVEVFARDRPGLLYAVVAALADAGLDISVSKIATEGEKVSDVFYVTAGGAKLTEPAALAAVAARVAAAIEAE